MIRPIYFFGFISCACFAKDFIKFKRTLGVDGKSCAHELFIEPCNTLTKCATLCETNFGCERFFFMPGSNSCTGCLSSQIQTTSSSDSISYVLGDKMTYFGCYFDSASRVLNGAMTTSDSMTNELCMQSCKKSGFIYAGTQYSTDCFCGNSYDESGKRPESECSMGCSGDPNQVCGDGWKNSIYT